MIAASSGRADAQRARPRLISSVDVSATAVTYADSIHTRAESVTPAFRLDWSRVTIGGSATISQLSGGGSTVQASLAPSFFTPTAGIFAGEVAGDVGGSTHNDGSRTGQMLGLARLYAIGNGRGGWAGGGAGRTWDGVVWRDVLQAELGGWLSRANTTALASVTPVVVQDTIRYADVQGALRYPTGAFELGVTAGVRTGATSPAIGGSSRAWGSVSVTGWLSSRFALMGSAGSYPVDLTQGFPGGRFIALALRVSTPNARQAEREADAAAQSGGGLEFEVRSTTADVTRRELRVLAPNARSVDITADFTQWIPVALTRAADGWWTLTRTIAPGTYQMNMRIDGGPWLVPAGLVSSRDEFGGITGILTIE